MATGLINVTALHVVGHEPLGLAPASIPGASDSAYLGPASPEAVAGSIARRARIRLLAAMAPLTVLFITLLVIINGAAL